MQPTASPPTTPVTLLQGRKEQGGGGGGAGWWWWWWLGGGGGVGGCRAGKTTSGGMGNPDYDVKIFDTSFQRLILTHCLRCAGGKVG